MNLALILTLPLAALLGLLFFRRRRARQQAFIRSYRFHPTLSRKVLSKYPHLNEAQLAQVFEGLRDFFLFCHQSRRRMVAMPSQVVDVAWHEFILFTRAYADFSRRAIGRFLHHTPTVAMKTPTLAQEGIKRAWRLACAKEGINPAVPERLPLLFALDAQLEIGDGFRYALDCKDKASPNYGDGYCAGHIGCSSGCSGDSGDPSADGGSGGDGDGGSSCGGGCGGD